MSRLFSGTPFDQPKPCPHCGLLPSQCRCLTLPEKNQKSKTKNQKLDSGLTLTPQNSKPPEDQVAKIKLEKRKGNREVTLITGLDHPANDLPKLCTLLRQLLGTGGSVQNRTIELQGNHLQKLPALLEQQNLKSRTL